ncbi:ABC transporter substrate-binding protein [Streptomyces sp. MA5143a]|uniref:ABC transporter substrate-binding protein n=1 Tax=Streptomyces sp. MA5143a TaxID=2083010 RepID=UPI000D1BBAA3|nr:ABC transporter substrate-binding protein [Streptomyces sp. MA5143a]SPF01350.1 putative D,D-dipeptide-binding periplasmic protein DdpA precursor [Streptomyces sp. MA5143a]
MNRKTLVLPAVLGLLAPVIAACGATDGASSDGDAIVVGTTDRFTASKEAPAPIDPAYAYDVGTWNILRQTVQTLLVQPSGDGEPEPEAASRCGFTDTGSERYVCTLRDGLKFADGSPITAEDVKFSIDRARSIKADSGVFALLSTIDLVETKGDKQVIFHLNGPDATLPYKLSTPVAGIVNPADYDKDKLRDGFKVDGSGPYTLDAEVENNELVKAVFTKNPHYRGHLDPKNDQIELRSFADPDAMGSALENGDIDLMTRTMTPEQIDKYAKSEDENIDLIESSGLEIRYLAFNTDASPVKSTAVRRAVAQLIDRGALVSKVYGSQSEPLFSVVPAGITGHSNSFFNKYGDPSVPKATEILKQAGITTPVKLTLHYTTDHYGAATKTEFEVLKKQLDAGGLFDVTIKGAPWSTFRPAEQKGEYAVYGMGWFPDFPDADNYLAPFLDKDNFLNSPYDNSEIRSKLIPESRREADRLTASKSLTGIQDIVADDVPILPLWQGNQYVAARDDVTGAEYALNSASTLQLWQLGRGIGD